MDVGLDEEANTGAEDVGGDEANPPGGISVVDADGITSSAAAKAETRSPPPPEADPSPRPACSSSSIFLILSKFRFLTSSRTVRSRSPGERVDQFEILESV